MLTAGDIIDAVRASGYEVDQDDQAFVFLNVEQRTLVAEHRWRFMLESAQISGAVGTSTYSLATLDDLMHLVSIRFTQTDQTFYELNWMDSEQLISRSMEEVELGNLGQPAYWSDTTPGAFTIFPTPMQGGVFTVRYLRRATDLLDESDVPDIPPEYLDVLRAGVCQRLAVRERQFDTAQSFANEKAILLAAMKGQYGLRQTQNAHRVVQSGRYGYTDDPRRRLWH